MLTYYKTTSNRKFFKYAGYTTGGRVRLNIGYRVRGFPINGKGELLYINNRADYYYVPWAIGEPDNRFTNINYEITKLKHPFKRPQMSQIIIRSPNENGPLWFKNIQSSYEEIASSRGGECKAVDIRNSVKKLIPNSIISSNLNKLFLDLCKPAYVPRTIGETIARTKTPVTNRQGYITSRAVYVEPRPFKTTRRDPRTPHKFFKTKEFYNWFCIFTRAITNMLPNDNQGNCYFRVLIYGRGYSMGSTGRFHIVTKDINGKIVKASPYYTGEIQTVRLSHNPDILLLGILVATMEFVLRFYSKYVEKYDEDDEDFENYLRDVKFVEFTFPVRTKMNALTIRAGNESTLNYLVHGYLNHSNKYRRYNFSLLDKYMKDNKLKIISPSSRLHCIVHCFVIAKNKEFHKDFYITMTDRKKKKTLLNKVNTIVDKLDTTYADASVIFKNLAKIYFNTRITVYNFAFEVVWDSKKYQKKLTEEEKVYVYKNNKDHIEMVIGRGHCFVLVPREKDENVYELKSIPFVKDVDYIPNKSVQTSSIINKPKVKKPEYNIVIFDIETLADTVEPYAIGWKINNDKLKISYRKNCVEDFIRDLVLPRQNFSSHPIYIFAHNGGGFDFHFIIDTLLSMRDLKVNISNCLDINGSLVQINFSVKILEKSNTKKVKRSFRKFILKDSLPIFAHMSLDDLAKDFKVEHLKGSIPHKAINSRTYPCFKNDVIPYLRNDVLGLREVLMKYRSINLEKWGADPLLFSTAASYARHLFFTYAYKFLHYPLYRVDDGMDAFIRKGYYGGRVECGAIGSFTAGKFYYWDFTSLFPSRMVMGMPWGVPRYVGPGPAENIGKNNLLGIYKCEVVSPNSDHIPVLPVRSDNGLIFPVFKKPFTGFWCTDEIVVARDIGYKIKVIEGVEFQSAKYYKELITHLFAAKLEATQTGDKALKRIAKIIINASYGFWATKYKEVPKTIMETRTQSEPDPSDKYKELDKLINQRVEGDLHIMRVRDRLDIPYVYSAISAIISSKARVLLWHLLNDVKQLGGKVYYMDTDSIITDFQMEGSKLEPKYIGKEKGELLGQLKSEFGYGNYATSLVVGGPKIYCFKGAMVPKEHLAPKFKGFYKKRKWRIEMEENTLSKKIKNKKKNTITTKVVSDKKQIIKFIEDEKGTDTLQYEHIEAMTEGARIQIQTNRINGKTAAWLEKGVSILPCKITFKCDYKKGVMLPDGDIKPFTI